MSTFKSRLKEFLRKWLNMDEYPKGKPLVYICKYKGYTGLVLAQDYDEAIREARMARSDGGRTREPIPMPSVKPVFLFTDMQPSAENLVVGNLGYLQAILDSCDAEYRTFLLPPIKFPYHERFKGVVGDIDRMVTKADWLMRNSWYPNSFAAVLHYIGCKTS